MQHCKHIRLLHILEAALPPFSRKALFLSCGLVDLSGHASLSGVLIDNTSEHAIRHPAREALSFRRRSLASAL